VVSILRHERKIVRRFQEAGALTAATAKSLDDLHPGHRLALHRLRNRAVIRVAQPDRFYLDLEVWVAVSRTRRRVSLAVLALIILLFIGVLAVRSLIAPS
jgi:hypothetical protein